MKLLVLIDFLSVPCLCFLAGISKSNFGASGVIPAVPGKKEDSPEKAPDSTTLTLNDPLEKPYFPHGPSGDAGDIYLISNLKWPL